MPHKKEVREVQALYVKSNYIAHGASEPTFLKHGVGHSPRVLKNMRLQWL